MVTMQILLNFLGSGVILVSGGKFRHTLISLQTEISQFALALHFPLMIFKVKMIKKNCGKWKKKLFSRYVQIRPPHNLICILKISL